MNLIFGREPALVLALVYALVQGVTVFGLSLTGEQQGVINAAASAVVGLVLAAKVAKDKLVPSVLGVVQAFVALAVAFGAGLSPEQQGVIMTLASAVVGMYVRTQVTAPYDADGNSV